MYLSLDRNLVGGDEVVRSSSFPTYRHDGGRGCRSAVLRGDHHCDVVWWSRWSELGGAARDVVDMVRGRRGRSSAELLETWSTWSVVDVATRSVRWSEGMYLVPSHGEAKVFGHVQPRSGAVGDLPCLRESYGVA